MILLTAVIGFVGLGLQTYGYQREKASRASVMNFIEIPFAYLLQDLMFHRRPNWRGIIGIVLVMVSGLLNVIRDL